LDRHRRTEAERISLSKQLLALQDLVASQQNQIQSEKMIIKFKESTIAMLRKNQLPASVDWQQKDEEIEMLRRIIDNHPEITRFAAENLQLREKLSQFDQMSAELHRLESIHAESKKYEMALADQLIASNDELRAVTEALENLQQTKISDQMLNERFKDILVCLERAIQTSL
jgi:kinesin family protein 15